MQQVLYNCRKCLICRKSTFSHLFCSIFFFENTAIQCFLVPNVLEIQSRTRSTLSQNQHSKRLLNAIAHKHSIKYNPFFISLYVKYKKVLVLNISYVLLNLSLGLFQTCSHSFTDFKDCMLMKLLLQQ